MEWISVAIVALVTLFEIDKTFGIVKGITSTVMIRLWLWELGFALGNCLLSLILYQVLLDTKLLDSFSHNPQLRAVASAMAYLALIRSKITTLRVKDQEIPLGIEFLYEGGKKYVYAQINEIVVEARLNATRVLVKNNLSECNNDVQEALGQLAENASQRINLDALFSDQDRRRLKGWMVKVLKDESSTTENKCYTMAGFILFKIVTLIEVTK